MEEDYQKWLEMVKKEEASDVKLKLASTELKIEPKTESVEVKTKEEVKTEPADKKEASTEEEKPEKKDDLLIGQFYSEVT